MKQTLNNQPKIRNVISPIITRRLANHSFSEPLTFASNVDSFRHSEKQSKKKPSLLYRVLLVPLIWMSGISGVGFLEFQAIKYLD